MRILCACEESQAVTIAFRELGHEAYSCDLEPCNGGHPEWHMQGDAKKVASCIKVPNPVLPMNSVAGESVWDMIIAFPPCTHLCVSGARHFAAKRADGRQQAAIDFFMFWANHSCQRVAIENPIGIMSTVYRKPDQIIQPWQFGLGETKATCLWLKGLPPLTPTNIVDGRKHRIHTMPPSKNRSFLRSKTYPGIASAMAQQWGCPPQPPKETLCQGK